MTSFMATPLPELPRNTKLPDLCKEGSVYANYTAGLLFLTAVLFRGFDTALLILLFVLFIISLSLLRRIKRRILRFIRLSKPCSVPCRLKNSDISCTVTSRGWHVTAVMFKVSINWKKDMRAVISVASRVAKKRCNKLHSSPRWMFSLRALFYR